MWIGVDAGGTSTEAVVGRDTVLGRGFGGPANATRQSQPVLRQSLEEAVSQALSAAGCTLPEVEGVCLGVAGVALAAARHAVMGVVHELFGAIPAQIYSDVRIALAGALGHQTGIVVQAGTGSVALSSDGRRCGGWGWLVGDEGSATHVGRGAVQCALQAFDGRGEQTRLLPAMLAHWKLSTCPDAVAKLHQSAEPAVLLAGLFPVVVEVADLGDAVATALLAAAGHALARLVLALGPADAVAYGGSIFRYSHHTTEAMVADVRQAWHIEPHQALRTPAEGALWLARQTSQPTDSWDTP